MGLSKDVTTGGPKDFVGRLTREMEPRVVNSGGMIRKIFALRLV